MFKDFEDKSICALHYNLISFDPKSTSKKSTLEINSYGNSSLSVTKTFKYLINICEKFQILIKLITVVVLFSNEKERLDFNANLLKKISPIKSKALFHNDNNSYK